MMRTKDEIQAKMKLWAESPSESEPQLEARHEAWCFYVDARDGLPDGTTIAKTPFQPRLIDNQMSLFRRFA